MSLTIGPGVTINPGMTMIGTVGVAPPPPPPHGSGVFDGSSWMVVTGGEQFNLGSTWTIEFSINPDDTSLNAFGGIWGIMNQGGWAVNSSINIALAGGFLIVGGGFDGSTENYHEPPTGRWTYIAIVNNAGNISVFYNGISQPLNQYGPGNRGTFNLVSTAPLYIGRLTPNYGGIIPAKIANIRITDQALYTSGDFIPDVVPTLISGHTRLLWKPTNGSITTDSGDYSSPITNNGVTYNNGDIISSAIPRNAYVFNGSNSYLTVADNTADWNLGNFYTIEWWSNAAIQSDNSQHILTVMCQEPGDHAIDIFYYDGKLNLFNQVVQIPEPPINEWTHVIVTGNNGRIRISYNGVEQYNEAAPRTASNNSLELIIGKRGAGNYQYFNGKLAGIRICFLYSDTTQNMLLLTNNTPTDTSGRAHTITNSAVTVVVDGTY